jgi:hypothetical protein
MATAVKLNLIKLITDADDSIISELRDDISDLTTLNDSLKLSVKKRLDTVSDSSESSSESSEESVTEEGAVPTGSWEILTVNNNYEINDAYPYRIRKKNHTRLIKEFKRNRHGYRAVSLEDVLFYKHVVIAKQWISNSGDTGQHKVVDHINRKKSDNHISNLRWVTSSENNLNKSGSRGRKYEYVSTLPEGSVEVNHCNNWNFMNLYYHDGEFFSKVGVAYRKLVQLDNENSKHFHMKDSEGKSRAVAGNIFNRKFSCGVIGK